MVFQLCWCILQYRIRGFYSSSVGNCFGIDSCIFRTNSAITRFPHTGGPTAIYGLHRQREAPIFDLLPAKICRYGVSHLPRNMSPLEFCQVRMSSLLSCMMRGGYLGIGIVVCVLVRANVCHEISKQTIDSCRNSIQSCHSDTPPLMFA